MNENAPINIECIDGDRDLSDSIKRSEYIELLKGNGIFSRVNAVVAKAIEKSGLQASSFHTCEWLGSTLRIQFIREAVAEFLGRPLASTLNAEEVIAKVKYLVLLYLIVIGMLFTLCKRKSRSHD